MKVKKFMQNLTNKNNLIPIVFLIIIASCQKPKSILTEDELLFKNIIDNTLGVFKKYDSVNYKTNTNYVRAVALSNSADRIIESIKNNKIINDSVTFFTDKVNDINTYSKVPVSLSLVEELKSNENSVLAYKIRVYETLAINLLLNRFTNNYVPMEYTVPIVIPNKNEINLGENFIADIYLAGANETNKFLVIINNDTLKYAKNSHTPRYEEKPTTRGEKSINGLLQFYHPGIGKIVKYDFTYKYTVK